MKKSKLLISLILVAMVVFLFFNVSVNAAVSIRSANASSNEVVNNSVVNNRVGNIAAANVSNYANTSNKTANYVAPVNNVGATNTSNSTKLPKTGAADMTGVIALGVVFIGVAVFTYKKVTDYNL